MSGPEAKRVKFSEVLEQAQNALPTVNVSSYALSSAISEEFPLSVSKRLGEKKHWYIYGVEITSDVGSSTTASSSSHVLALEQSLEQERRTNDSLRQQVLQLQQQLDDLKQSYLPIKKLDDQMQQLLRPDKNTFHGPDTVDHFQTFSLDAVVAEMRACAPDLQQLFQQLGKGERFEDDELTRIAQLRSTTALCTLTKSRSVKVLGVQLLISFMLIGRTTSKQVRTIITFNYPCICITLHTCIGNNRT